MPKGLEVVGDERIIDRVISSIKAVTPDIVLSANAKNAHTWLPSVVMMSDKMGGIGGIAGIHSALLRGRDVLAVAWDMPFVSGDFLRTIVSLGQRHRADAAVPESDSPHGIEPFCAWYAQSALPAMDAFVAGGGGSARDCIARLGRVEYVPLSVTRRFGDPRRIFFSVNTAEDLDRARILVRAP